MKFGQLPHQIKILVFAIIVKQFLETLWPAKKTPHCNDNIKGR
jgi:hypothetical protein